MNIVKARSDDPIETPPMLKSAMHLGEFLILIGLEFSCTFSSDPFLRLIPFLPAFQVSVSSLSHLPHRGDRVTNMALDHGASPPQSRFPLSFLCQLFFSSLNQSFLAKWTSSTGRTSLACWAGIKPNLTQNIS